MNLGREAMVAVAERTHAEVLSDTPLASDPVSVTMPRSVNSSLHSHQSQTLADGATIDQKRHQRVNDYAGKDRGA
jgi:hypothetical protein